MMVFQIKIIRKRLPAGKPLPVPSFQGLLIRLEIEKWKPVSRVSHQGS
jgi:hypothetical protein